MKVRRNSGCKFVFYWLILSYLDNVNCLRHPDEYLKYTEAEKAAIIKFRKLAGENLYRDYMKTDLYLIRWLRDSNMDLNVAKNRMQKYHDYRKKHRIDSILSENFSDMKKEFPFNIIEELDLDGSPIATFAFGKCNLRKLMLMGLGERIFRYIDFAFESCWNKVMRSNATAIHGIVDLNGYSLRTHGCLACIPAFIQFVRKAEDHYPQTIKYFDVINTPRIFQPMFQFIVPMLSPYTKSIVRLFTVDKSEWVPIVLEKIPKEILPPEYGGTKKQ